jgi:glycosyltransferase involved in cell wall biosynthesis
MDNIKIVTIWNTYGPYHLARVRALQKVFQDASVICFSHCATNRAEYPFFNLMPENGEVIVQKDESDLSFRQSFFSTWRLLKKHKPALVLACGYERSETLAAVIYARWFHKACFLMVDNQYDDSSRKKSIEFVKKLYLKIFDGYAYGGSPHYRYLVRLGVKLDRAVSGYNCVDNDAITSMAAQYRRGNTSMPPGEDYALCIGRLIEKKNWRRLLVAFRQYIDRIRPEKHPWKLMIVGDGPMRQEVEKLIWELALDDLVLMKGQVSCFSEIVRLNALAKLCVLASTHNEQWGLVVNEAMAAGRPVLVSQKCGCVEDLVCDGKNGFAFDPYSTQDIAEKLLWMHHNEDRLDEMGHCSHQMIENISPMHFAEKVRDLYERPG